jgi:GH15 family glucan-1,4-alpha-glucosidase
MFFDKRFRNCDLNSLFLLLESVGEKCAVFYKEADEIESHGSKGRHTVSAVQCWAGTDRLAKIAETLGRKDRAAYWRVRAQEIEKVRWLLDLSSVFSDLALILGCVGQVIMETAFDQNKNTFVATYEPFSVDTHAQLLDLWAYGLLAHDHPRMLGTVAFMESQLKIGDEGLKRSAKDHTADFTATFTFVLNIVIDHTMCSSKYLLDACLVNKQSYIRYLSCFQDRRTEATNLFAKVVAIGKRSEWCFAEKWDPETKEMWGNFPYGPAAAALVECALKLSKPWNVVV